MSVDLVLMMSLTVSLMLMYATPLIFTSMGGLISERSGVLNIGLEGMMSIGAFIAAAMAFYFENPYVGFLWGGLAGALLAFIYALFVIHGGANQVVCSIAIVLLGSSLSRFLSNRWFGSFDTPPLGDGKLPNLFSFLFSETNVFSLLLNHNVVTYLALFLVFFIHFILNKTVWGLRLRSLGENPYTSQVMGINVTLLRYICVTLSGFLAGLGGAALALSVNSYFTATLVSGQGFIALAALIFGRWKPIYVLFACFLFSLSVVIEVQVGSYLPIPTSILNTLPYFITLLFLILFRGNMKPPQALGKPYKAVI